MKDFSFSLTFFVIITLLVSLATLVFVFFTFRLVSTTPNLFVVKEVSATPTPTTITVTPTQVVKKGVMLRNTAPASTSAK